jgi:hypothetical protein
MGKPTFVMPSVDFHLNFGNAATGGSHDAVSMIFERPVSYFDLPFHWVILLQIAALTSPLRGTLDRYIEECEWQISNQ